MRAPQALGFLIAEPLEHLRRAHLIGEQQRNRAGGAGWRDGLRQRRGLGAWILGPLDRVDQLAGPCRWSDSELAAQSILKSPIRGERRRPVAGGREQPDQLALGMLGERIERYLAPGERDGCVEVSTRFRVGSELREDIDEVVSMLVASLIYPILVEALEQSAAGQLERVLAPAGRQKGVELRKIDPYLVGP